MKAVLFDMDGVLLDSERPTFGMLQRTLESKGVSIPLEDLLQRYSGMFSSDIYAELIAAHGFRQSVEEFRAEHRRLNGNYYQDGDLEPMPGLPALLQWLREAGTPMAAVSSTVSRNVLFALNRLSILRFFDAVVCGDMVAQTKPAPDGYQAAARYLGVDPADCLAIEDSPLGVQSARNAGIFVVGYKGGARPQDTAQAELQVDSFDELLQWMQAQPR